MGVSESVVNGSLSTRTAPKIASWSWLVGFLVIGAGVVVAGYLAQNAPASGGSAAASGQLANHSQAVPTYLMLIGMDWALLYYCWVGVRRFGGSLTTLSGRRWKSWRTAAEDLAIALPFWALWEGAAYGVHWLLQSVAAGSSAVKTVDSLLPRSLLEVVVWIGASLTAGICEEIAFRGFLQKQFHALTGNIAAAVVAQGAVFGLFHAYQGWRNVVVIAVLGVLYGAMAAWRGNLRVNILSHAWTDIWEGWLKFAILR